MTDAEQKSFNQYKRAAEFAALWTWRKPSNPKALTNEERLEIIKFHPDIMDIAECLMQRE